MNYLLDAVNIPALQNEVKLNQIKNRSDDEVIVESGDSYLEVLQ